MTKRAAWQHGSMAVVSSSNAESPWQQRSKNWLWNYV